MTVIGIDPSLRGFGVSDGNHHFVIKTEKREEEQTQAEDLLRRCSEIIGAFLVWIGNQHNGERLALYVEAPAFGAAPSAGSHLYELGWLMYRIHLLTETFVDRVKVVEVPPATLRKWATGKGNTPKDMMRLAVYKKFHIEFDDDPGNDKLFAYLLCKFGEGVESGAIPFTTSAKRTRPARRAVRS